MFNCRDLDGGLSVLHKDYSIKCSTDQQAAFELIAAAYVACVSLGIPLYMVRLPRVRQCQGPAYSCTSSHSVPYWQVLLMVRRMRDYAGASASERFVARRVADELKLADRVAADVIRDVTMGREYFFLVNAYKPRYYYWEVGIMVFEARNCAAYCSTYLVFRGATTWCGSCA
jgi:hypothetical protein